MPGFSLWRMLPTEEFEIAGASSQILGIPILSGGIEMGAEKWVCAVLE